MASTNKHNEKKFPHKDAFERNAITKQGFEDLEFFWGQLQIIEHRQDHDAIKKIGQRYGWGL